MHLIDYCGEPYSDITICCEERFKGIDEKMLYELLETSSKKSIKARLNDAYKKIVLEG
ncbi:hypothetical protein [Anaerovirgula multivorans]|nr:hypothetical protein [Anaerovirgula multivorans]